MYANKRRSRKKRRMYGRKYKNNPQYNTLNKKIKKIENKIELLHEDSIFATTVGNDGADRLLLNGITQGQTDITRVGNEVTATSLQFRGRFETNSGLIVPTCVRVIIFWDRQANGAIPITLASSTPSDMALLDNTITTDPLLMPYNYTTIDRYRVLYDKVFVMNPQVVAGTEAGATDAVIAVTKYFKGKIKLNRRIKFDTTGSTVASITTNALWAVFYSDVVTDEPALDFVARFYYKDA